MHCPRTRRLSVTDTSKAGLQLGMRRMLRVQSGFSCWAGRGGTAEGSCPEPGARSPESSCCSEHCPLERTMQVHGAELAQNASFLYVEMLAAVEQAARAPDVLCFSVPS